jgi:proteasome accessory factor C
VRAAADAHRRLRIAYAAASTAERSERTIDPEAVFASSGRWYVAAWDVDVDDERLFRIDRIDAVDPTAETFAPRGLQGAGRPLYSPGGEDLSVRLRLTPPARWVAEYYVATDATEEADGSLTVTLPTKQVVWLARLLLRLGPDATVVEPEAVREEVCREAELTLARYRT